MRCRRYILTLNNQPFAYKSTGGALFFSMLLVFIIYGISLSIMEHGHPSLGCTLFSLLITIIPFMEVKGLQYQAMVTSLNIVRFGFQCSILCYILRVWWCMFAIPALLMVALYVVLSPILSDNKNHGGLVFNIVLLGLLTIVGMEGIYRFTIQVDVKTYIRGCVLVMLALFPYYCGDLLSNRSDIYRHDFIKYNRE